MLSVIVAAVIVAASVATTFKFYTIIVGLSLLFDLHKLHGVNAGGGDSL